jgi:hypothetical protein
MKSRVKLFIFQIFSLRRCKICCKEKDGRGVYIVRLREHESSMNERGISCKRKGYALFALMFVAALEHCSKNEP